MFQRSCLSALLLMGLATPAWAHYLWVAATKDRADIYFEEGPHAGDGGYLDPFVSGNQTWIRTIESPQPKRLETKEVTEPKKRWLTTSLNGEAPRSVDCYGKFGVYRYGQTDVLLHYYARHLDVSTYEQMHALAQADQMNLDIVPRHREGELELTVRWKGKPAAGRTVYLRGPKKFKQNPKTDEQGVVRFKAEAPGRYLLRTSVELEEAGQDNGKDYSKIRHNATLVLNLPLKE